MQRTSCQRERRRKPCKQDQRNGLGFPEGKAKLPRKRLKAQERKGPNLYHPAEKQSPKDHSSALLAKRKRKL